MNFLLFTKKILVRWLKVWQGINPFFSHIFSKFVSKRSLGFFKIVLLFPWYFFVKYSNVFYQIFFGSFDFLKPRFGMNILESIKKMNKYAISVSPAVPMTNVVIFIV